MSSYDTLTAATLMCEALHINPNTAVLPNGVTNLDIYTQKIQEFKLIQASISKAEAEIKESPTGRLFLPSASFSPNTEFGGITLAEQGKEITPNPQEAYQYAAIKASHSNVCAVHVNQVQDLMPIMEHLGLDTFDKESIPKVFEHIKKIEAEAKRLKTALDETNAILARRLGL